MNDTRTEVQVELIEEKGFNIPVLGLIGIIFVTMTISILFAIAYLNYQEKQETELQQRVSHDFQIVVTTESYIQAILLAPDSTARELKKEAYAKYIDSLKNPGDYIK